MGKFVCCLILLLALLWHPLYGQHVFNIAYDHGITLDVAADVIQSRNGGYFIVGRSRPANAASQDSVVCLKLNAAGAIEWKYTTDIQPNAGPDMVRSVVQIADGSYLICGYALNVALTDMDSYLLKITEDGQFVWLRHYGIAGANQYVEQLKQTSDGGYILAGHYDPISASTTAWMVKTDSLGIEEWQQQYAPVPGIAIFSVDLTKDGGYVLGGEGFPSSPAGLNRQMLMIKIDSLGNQQWYKHFGGTSDDGGQSVIATLDGGYFLVGYQNDGFSYAIKTNHLGIEDWHYQSSLGYYSIFMQPLQIPDSSYILLSGFTNASVGTDMALVKITAQGNFAWQKTYTYYSGFHEENFYSIDYCTDGGFVMAGMVVNNALPQKNDMWILKTDACGNTVGDTLNPQAGMSLSNGIGVNADSYSFTNQSTGHCWQIWYFGDGDSTLAANPQHTYQPGTYTITLVAFAGAYSDTITQQITVLPCGAIPGDTLLPTAAMLVSSGTQNGTYSFQSQSSEYCSLLWYFGDGETSTAPNPQHQYQQSGTYTITHIAFKGAYSDTVTQEVTVLYPCNMAPADTLQPEAEMLISPSTQTGAYSFTSQSTEYCSLLWYFGDGDSTTTANPQHTYQQSGSYEVMHIAIAGLEADTVTEQISVLVGVEETLINHLILKVYPNPTSGNYTVNYDQGPSIEEAFLCIYNVQGRLVEKHKLNNSTTSLELNAADLPKGLYLLQASCKGQKATHYKLTVQ